MNRHQRRDEIEAQEPPETFEKWIKDPKNDAAFLRHLEREGIIESFIGPDGKIWCRRVDKQPLKPPGIGEFDA
jgi:hypothetical protein